MHSRKWMLGCDRMKRKAKISIAEYLWDHIFWGFLSAYWYRQLCFRCVPTLSLVISTRIFWGLNVFLILLSFLLTCKKRRTKINMWATIAFPSVMYFCISFGKEYVLQLSVFAIILISVLLLYTVAVAANLAGARTRGVFYPIRKIAGGLIHGYRVLVGTSSGVLLCVFLLGVTLGITGFKPNEKAANPTRHTVTISENIETVCLLQEDEWDRLSVQERLDVLQVIANIEASYLGLPHELNVFSTVMDDDLSGYYNDATHSIYLNLDDLSYGSAHDALDTLTHEAYHAYEHRLVDLYEEISEEHRSLLLLEAAAEYKYEFANYIDGDEDLFGYATQSVELDCMKYSIIATDDYYTRIDEHLTTNE